MPLKDLAENSSGKISAAKDGKGEITALMIDAGALLGCTGTDDSEPEWYLLSEEPLEEIHLAHHARDGRMVALGRKPDGSLVHRWFRTGDLLPWKWETLDGHTDLPMRLLERQTGGIEAFLIDREGILWHRWTNREFQWADAWASLESRPCEKTEVLNNTAGFPQAYVLLTDHTGISVRRHLNDGTWNDWNDLGGKDIVSFSVTAGKDGMAVLTAEDARGRQMECRQTEMDAYTGWSYL